MQKLNLNIYYCPDVTFDRDQSRDLEISTTANREVESMIFIGLRRLKLKNLHFRMEIFLHLL